MAKINTVRDFLKAFKKARKINPDPWMLRIGGGMTGPNFCCPVTFVQNPSDPRVSGCAWDQDMTVTKRVRNAVIDAADYTDCHVKLRAAMLKVVGL